MRALRGTTIAGFPNLCMVIGPNTGPGHNRPPAADAVT